MAKGSAGNETCNVFSMHVSVLTIDHRHAKKHVCAKHISQMCELNTRLSYEVITDACLHVYDLWSSQTHY